MSIDLSAEDKAWSSLIDMMMDWYESTAYTRIHHVNRKAEAEFDALYKRVCDLSNRPASVATAALMGKRFKSFIFRNFGEGFYA